MSWISLFDDTIIRKVFRLPQNDCNRLYVPIFGPDTHPDKEFAAIHFFSFRQLLSHLKTLYVKVEASQGKMYFWYEGPLLRRSAQYPGAYEGQEMLNSTIKSDNHHG